MNNIEKQEEYKWNDEFGVTMNDLVTILSSDSLYRCLRYAVKSPERVGVDECDDDYYYDLYNLCAKLRSLKNKNVQTRLRTK